MPRKYVLVFTFLFVALSFLVAQDGQSAVDNSGEATPTDSVQNSASLEEFQPVEGLNQWQKEFDISGLDAGIYNLLVRAEDAAGNVVEAEPVDIRIDPESDLPHSSITYPSRNLRLSGNLTVLGSASDDDEVDFVDVRIGDGEFIRADGSEYWSASFDLGDFPDGLYTLVSRATDINGLQGPEQSRSFYLDRHAPQISVESHHNGDLVSGRFSINGTTSDSNGISGMEYSLNDGQTWEDAKLPGSARNGEAAFSIPVDSRNFEDGPHVLLFRSTDLQGSVAEGALLLSVDNTPPDLDIVYPREDVPENGYFMVAGRALDDTGVASLSWTYRGGEPQEITLEPGNSFWSAMVDFVGQKQMDLSFVISDVAGNTRTINLKRDLDWEADLPRIILDSPGDTPMSLGDRRISGWISDDDGPGGIVYRIDRGEDISLETGRSFDIPLEDIAPGEHVLTIRAVDNRGLEGEDIQQTFSVLPSDPKISVEGIADDQGGFLDYQPGLSFRSDEYRTISGSLEFDSGSGTASYRLPGGEETELKLVKTAVPGRFSYRIDIGTSAPFGYLPLVINADDALGSSSATTAYFWSENLSRNLQEYGFYLPAGDRAVMAQGESYELRFIGHPLAELEISGSDGTSAPEGLKAENDRGFIKISSVDPGVFRGLSLNGVTDRGTEFSTALPELVFDYHQAQITLDGDPSGTYSGRVNISGLISDDGAEPVLEYRVNGGAFSPVNLSADEQGWSFRQSIDLSALETPAAIVQLRVTDSAGRRVSAYRSYVRGNNGEDAKPALQLLAAGSGGSLLSGDLGSADGGVYLAAVFSGISDVRNIQLAIDEGSPVSLSPDGPSAGGAVAESYVPLSAFTGGQGSHSVSVTASYGEDKQLKASLKINIIAGIPGLKVQGPGTGTFVQGMEVIRNADAALLVRPAPDWTIKELSYVFDDGEELSARAQNDDSGSYFSLTLDDLKYGRHRVEIRALDQWGREVNFGGFFYLLADSTDRHIDDENKIYSLGRNDGRYFFYMNGRQLVSAELINLTGAAVESVDLALNGRIITLDLGTEKRIAGAGLRVSTVDGETFDFGPADYSADRSAPDMAISSPEDSGYYSGEVLLEGRAVDDDAIETLDYRIGYGSWMPIVTAGAAGVFSISVPLDGQADGPMVLEIRAADPSANSTLRRFLLIHASQAPSIELLLPSADEPVNGSIPLIFRAGDIWSEGLRGIFTLGDRLTEISDDAGFLSVPADFSPYAELPESFSISLTDSAGNVGELIPVIKFDPESDKPRISVQLPGPNTLFTDDVLVSGTVLDDDGVGEIRYRLDGGDEVSLPSGNSFEISIPFDTLADNEHSLEISAFDLMGVAGDPVVLPFRISREAPEASLTSPVLGSTNRANITLEGKVSDANGISAVMLSLDNGLSYQTSTLIGNSDGETVAGVGQPTQIAGAAGNTAVTATGDASGDTIGGESAGTGAGNESPALITRMDWTYPLDTRTLVDGNYMVLIKAIDRYGVESLSSALLTVDNTGPKLEVSLPLDGREITDSLPLQLRITDELNVSRISYQISRLNGESDTSAGIPVSNGTLPVNHVVLTELDTSGFEPGLYNLSISGFDSADNETIVSRNFMRRETSLKSVGRILFPLTGSTETGAFNIDGIVDGDYIPPTVSIFRNGSAFAVVEPDANGYFSCEVEPDSMDEGQFEFTAILESGDGNRQVSEPVTVDYLDSGGWISIDSVRTGDYVSQRPWIEGGLGFIAPPGEDPAGLSRDEIRGREVDELEYSLDNGRSFISFKAADEWKFRLETQELTDGQLSILVRARFRNGTVALDKVFVFVDDTPPEIAIVSPEEGLALNERVKVNGTAFDANGLQNIEIMLRPRSKNSYEVPQFIQGLYLDTHVLGGTTWEVGAGLTFFDNNVKLQFLYGQAPSGRFNGDVLGFKLLANVFSLPYEYLFGPDWDFLSSSIAIGAAFEYFTMTESPGDQPGLVLGAVVLQLELAKFELSNAGMFNAYSTYVENQLWFISSDVQGGLAYRLAFGLRINVF